MFELRGCSHFITYSGINSSAHQLLQRPFQLANQIEQLIKRTIIFNYPAGMNILSGFWLFSHPLLWGIYLFHLLHFSRIFFSLFYISAISPHLLCLLFGKIFTPVNTTSFVYYVEKQVYLSGAGKCFSTKLCRTPFDVETKSDSSSSL